MSPSAFGLKLRNFLNISNAEKLLFFEAVITSAYVKVVLLYFPFSKVAKWLGVSSASGNSHDVGTVQEIDIVKKIRFALRLCDKYTPWPTECYTRSLTGKIMLKRRSIASTLVFGFEIGKHEKKIGHAWLRSAGMIVTGFCDFSKFEVHSRFS